MRKSKRLSKSFRMRWKPVIPLVARLLNAFTTASSEERIEIEQKLEWLDGVTRQLNVSLKALPYAKKEPTLEPDHEQTAIEDHWIDRFNEVARKRNEKWRMELLARVLAKETSEPGSVSARLLWLIGVLEEEAFVAFSALLNVCVWFASVPDPGPFVPDSQIDAFNQPTEKKIRDHYATVGELHTALADTGLICDMFSSRKTIRRGAEFLIRHGDHGFRIILNTDICISGVLLSTLGHTLARFHDPIWTASGVQILEGWLASMPPRAVQITPLDPSKLDEAD